MFLLRQYRLNAHKKQIYVIIIENLNTLTRNDLGNWLQNAQK